MAGRARASGPLTLRAKRGGRGIPIGIRTAVVPPPPPPPPPLTDESGQVLTDESGGELTDE